MLLEKRMPESNTIVKEEVRMRIEECMLQLRSTHMHERCVYVGQTRLRNISYLLCLFDRIGSIKVLLVHDEYSIIYLCLLRVSIRYLYDFIDCSAC